MSLRFKVKKNDKFKGEVADVSNYYTDVGKHVKGYKSKDYVPLPRRREFCEKLSRENKLADEYYTRGKS